MTDQQERDTEREAFEAHIRTTWKVPTDYLDWALKRKSDGQYQDSRAEDQWSGWSARSQQQQQAFEAGWRTAANWMNRDDLIADIESPAYIKDRDAALSDLTGGGNG